MTKFKTKVLNLSLNLDLSPSVGQSTRNTVTTGLSGPAVHVLDRSIDSHRKASLPRPITYETHTVASQKQLAYTRVIRKSDSKSLQVPASPFTMVARRRQSARKPSITPNRTCSANLYKHIKRKVGCSLKRTHCQRGLVTARKQTAHKLSGTKNSLSHLERVPRPLYSQNSTCSNRQHHSDVLHKQARMDEIGPSVCPTIQDLDLVHQETSNSQSPTYTRPAERGSRQAVQTRPDHSNGVIPPSRGLSSYMQTMASASGTLICHEVQQQITSVCVTGSGSPSYSSGYTQSAMRGS